MTQEIFRDISTGFLYADKALKKQLLCKKHKHPIYLSIGGTLWCDRENEKAHHIRSVTPSKIIDIDTDDEGVEIKEIVEEK